LEGLPVTAEVCPHHLLLCDEDVANSGADPNLKMNPPLRSRQDVQACIAGLLAGTIDCIVTDHAPHTAQEKAVGFLKAPFGIVGLETAMPLTWRVLTESGRPDWSLLVRLMSVAPARVLGLPEPMLSPGAPAELTVIEPDARWTVDPAQFTSQSKNSPFAGWTITGRAVGRTFGQAFLDGVNGIR
jgi:dihydroorotase